MLQQVRLLILGMTLLSATGLTAWADQTVVVVLDDSGSMDKNIEPGRKKMAAAKDSLARVLRSLSRDTKVGVLALNSRVDKSPWIVPVGSPDVGRWESELLQVRAKVAPRWAR